MCSKTVGGKTSPHFVVLPFFLSPFLFAPKIHFRRADPDFGIGKAGNSITKSESCMPTQQANIKHTILAVRDYHCVWN